MDLYNKSINLNPIKSNRIFSPIKSNRIFRPIIKLFIYLIQFLRIKK